MLPPVVAIIIDFPLADLPCSWLRSTTITNWSPWTSNSIFSIRTPPFHSNGLPYVLDSQAPRGDNAPENLTADYPPRYDCSPSWPTIAVMSRDTRVHTLSTPHHPVTSATAAAHTLATHARHPRAPLHIHFHPIRHHQRFPAPATPIPQLSRMHRRKVLQTIRAAQHPQRHPRMLRAFLVAFPLLTLFDGITPPVDICP